MKHILIPAYTGIGNLILKTPMIKKIKELFPASKIDLLVGNNFGVEFILRNTDYVDGIIEIKQTDGFFEKFMQLRRLSKKNSYEILFLPFDSSPNFVYLFSLCFSGSKVAHFLTPKNIKAKIKLAFLLYLKKCTLVPVLQGRHEIDLNLDLLEAYINRPLSREYNTFIGADISKSALDKFGLTSGGYIAIQVGAANGQRSAKKWPLANFKELILCINRRYGSYKVVIVGDAGDYESDIVHLENQGLEFVNTAGKTTMDEVCSILNFSKLVIAHDSGIMHMANAIGCRLVALYGPTDYSRTSPLGENVVILYSKTDCFCKMYNFEYSEAEVLDHFADCMSGITVAQVLEQIGVVCNDQ